MADINECLDGTDSCEEGCTNVNGSYSCFCFNDTILANDGNQCLGTTVIIIIMCFSIHILHDYASDKQLMLIAWQL